MKKYQILEKFMQENKNQWYSLKEIRQYVKISENYIRELARIGFLLSTAVHEPMRIIYYKYNPKGGQWGTPTKLRNNGNR